MSFIKTRTGRKNVSEYIPKNPKKYTGGYPILVRSGWERKFCQWVDVNPSIIEWTSENITIQYLDPSSFNKKRRYYPDFYIKTVNLDKYLIEVKPLKDCRPPKKTARKSNKTFLTEQKTYQTNMAKFKAARRYCEKMGMQFKVMTEKELFGK